MNLMIVESPRKCKKIKSILGSGWQVEASFGHVRDLPEKRLGIDTDSYKPEYEITSSGQRRLTALKAIVKKANCVYLATDPDREGESIAWHLKVILKPKKYCRVSFNEITSEAVYSALEHTTDINMNLVKAQEARRVIDRLVGYQVSPAISAINNAWITAGRVQSIAVRIIVDRELRIRNFVPISYWDACLTFDADSTQWRAKWVIDDYLADNELYIQDEQLAESIATVRDVIVVSKEVKPENKKAPPPLITSTLQQVASTLYKYSPKQTMKLADELFAAGLITYHRTDNPNLSQNAFLSIINWLDINGYQSQRVNDQNTWKAKAGAQEGHEAIRPSDIALTPEAMSEIHTGEIVSIYRLIWHRAVASQLKPAKYLVTTIKLQGSEPVMGQIPTYLAKERVEVDSGWLTLGSLVNHDHATLAVKGEDSKILPDINNGQALQAIDGEAQSKLTRPPGRYTEASLVSKLETEGVGRPSTYASILDKIVQRSYVDIDKRKLRALEPSMKIYGLLLDQFSFFSITYTRYVERRLDAIASGKDKRSALLGDEQGKLVTEIQQLQNNNPNVRFKTGTQSQQVDQSYPCLCGNGYYQLKRGKRGSFFGCSTFPVCRNTVKDENGQPIYPDSRR